MNRYEVNFVLLNTDEIRSEYVLGKNGNDISKKLRAIYADQKIEIQDITIVQENIKTLSLK